MDCRVAIIIPTMNRSDFVVRQLRYYADALPGCSIYIGDSSDAQHCARIAEAGHQLSSKIKVKHLHVPGLNEMQAIHAASLSVEEPYAAFLGDDDFFIPASLEKCARFLDDNPDHSLAHGVAALCALPPKGSSEAIKAIVPYNLGSLEGSSGSARLLEFFSNYYVTLFSVHRTSSFQQDLEKSKDVPDPHFRELLSSALAAVKGKAKRLDCLFLIRGDHEERYRARHMFDWVTQDGWAECYRQLSLRLAEEIMLVDGSTEQAAQEIVTQSFWGYLAKGLTRKWHLRYGRPALSTKLYNLARQHPRVARAGRRAISLLPGDTNTLSLYSLLRPSSRYHSDFIPFYRFVTSAAGQLGSLRTTVEA